jgi:6-pyruvoyltetrahydropterin/6-carboxytetrahydropterin synthase
MRDSLHQIVLELDHHMLLPTLHSQINVAAAEEIEVRFEDRRWVFPAGDCVLLPVANTTAEQLAKYIGQRLLDAIRRKTSSTPRLVVGVDENQGQWGVWESG